MDESCFNQSQFKMSIYYNYATYRYKLVVLYYIDDCVYWYTSEELGKFCVDVLGNIFHVDFLGYEYWFMSIIISQLRDHDISVYRARHATSVVSNYLETITIK